VSSWREAAYFKAFARLKAPVRLGKAGPGGSHKVTCMSLLMIELNEINFEHVRDYVRLGKLPELGRLLANHALIETSSELDHDDLEPWIQWVTAHTGLPLAEHGVFRLGDILATDLPQVWETLEAQGLRVGAISPMNANNRCKDAAFFLPDPWTATAITGSTLMKKLYGAVAQAVNDNASSRLTPGSAAWLAAGLAAYASPKNYGRYLSMVMSAARGRPWVKALVLDQLLGDIFISQVRRKRPDFATLFLNAGAHVQHHYMFNAAVYDGPHANPKWYAPEGADPVLEVYELYDRLIGQFRSAFPDDRLMIATALHQDPYPEPTFYWRLKDHAGFLAAAEVPFARVEPRMSRDFVVVCADAAEAAAAEQRLAQIRTREGVALFDVDNRGDSLFVTLTWPHDIGKDFAYAIGNRTYEGLRDQVAFVALKNGGHNGVGYFIDTAEPAGRETPPIPLANLPKRVAAACGVEWAPA
jgi:hypothetical protein